MSLPFELGPWAAVWMAAAFFMAAFVRGYSGFGFAALLISAGSLVMNPLQLVAVAIIGDLVMSAQQWRGVRRDINWPRALALFAGALIGVPLGLWLLTAVPENAARAMIAIYVLVICVVLIAGWSLPPRVGPAATASTGVLSGVANAAGVGGLPVVVLFAAQRVEHVSFRATLIAYFTLLDLWTIPLLWQQSLIGPDTWQAIALAIPMFILGNWAGSRRFLRADQDEFRRFAIAALMGLAVLGLVKSVM